MNITIYESNTGRIIRNVNCPADLVNIQIQEGENYIEGEYIGKTFYIQDGYASMRLANLAIIDKTTIIADGNDKVTISNASGVLRLKGVEYVITESIIELTFDTAGDYTVFIESFPYLPWEVTIHAT